MKQLNQKNTTSKKNWGQRKAQIIDFALWVRHVLTFVIFLSAYLAMKLLSWFGNSRFCPNFLWRYLKWPMERFYLKILAINRHNERTINQYNLIELALRNMAYKKVRTAITVGGMAIGIGAIVFLVSVGFGLQRLVISRVARLDEMKQTDVAIQPGSQLKITDEALSKFTNLPDVDLALPQISLVARVSFGESAADVVAYGVTSDYLEQSAIKPSRGEIFESRELAVSQTFGEVAGSEDPGEPEIGGRIKDVQIRIDSEAWLKVRQAPESQAKVIGFTKDNYELVLATQLWGSAFPDNDFGSTGESESGQALGEWFEVTVPLWESSGCSVQTNTRCIDGYEPMVDDVGKQEFQKGYIARIDVQIVGDDEIAVEKVVDAWLEYDNGSVLGETDEASSQADLLEWIEIASESAAVASTDIQKIDIDGQALKQAVVNRSMLQLLNLEESQSIGKKFQVEYVVTGDLLESANQQIVSSPLTYTIVGVTPEENAPYFYAPFVDMRALGVANYSQVKVVADSPQVLARVRQHIEALGFSTVSVVDTVAQIDRLFATARSILALVGFVALSVASLGMFNTLTVSLLERTHEVGLMKALGMKSHEVQELFLTESMIMGFFGGLLGASLGIAAGEIVGVLLSAIGLVKGAGYIDVSYTPPSFLVGIFLLSLLVGLATGIFPARRAMKISALDALRYE